MERGVERDPRRDPDGHHDENEDAGKDVVNHPPAPRYCPARMLPPASRYAIHENEWGGVIPLAGSQAGG